MPAHLPPLPAALPGTWWALDGRAGRIGCYSDGPSSGTPLLLIHSINAAASACEVKPIYDHYRRERPVYALDLPGFGSSERSERRYDPRLMTDALHEVIHEIRRRHGMARVDALAVSLSCEYLARAAMEAPSGLRSIALVSPTGFSGTGRRDGPPGSTRALPALHRFLSWRGWRRGLYGLLTRPAVIRYFLQKTWGSRQIDEGLWAYDLLTARQPGAEHAPLYFLSGGLFSRDISRVYEALSLPVWMSHGTRGDFTDYRGQAIVAGRPAWHFDVFQAGALPYFEQPALFMQRYDAFLAGVDGAGEAVGEAA